MPASLFTEQLTRQIRAGGSLEEVFNRTGEAVFTTTQELVTQGKIDSIQTPAKYSLLYRGFAFGESTAPAPEDPKLGVMREALAKAEREKAEAEAKLAAGKIGNGGGGIGGTMTLRRAPEGRQNRPNGRRPGGADRG